MEWMNSAPSFGKLFSNKLIEEFGEPRAKDEPVEQHHMDMAASIQAVYETVFFHILKYVYEETGNTNICLSGGCALNSLANGKIFNNTQFKEIFIHPAAHDSGGAVGAAYYVYNHILGMPRVGKQENAYLGPAFSNGYISSILKSYENKLDGVKVSLMRNQNELIECAAKDLAEGKVLGWFQGRMEWGPRALGNRSILADPRRKDMKDMLNLKIKLREKFRPFAPSILEEYVGEYFEIDYPDPYMLKVYPIKEKMRKKIPAVTHEDGTGRLQTVSRDINPLYWKLINRFYEITDVPVLLNTSFNENEPIVCKPEEALECFLRTKMDVLVLGSYLVER
jgi:carbamoyltransferase